VEARCEDYYRSKALRLCVYEFLIGPVIGGSKMVWPFCGSRDEQLDAWLTAQRTPVHIFGFNQWLNGQTYDLRRADNREQAERRYLEEFDERFVPGADGVMPTVAIDTAQDGEPFKRVMERLRAADRFGISLQSEIRGEDFDLSGKWLTTLIIASGVYAAVNLRRCRITNLILGPGQLQEVNVIDCSLGELRLLGGTQELNIRNGKIRKLAAPQGTNFLGGAVTIRHVSLPTVEANVHALRQLRAELVRTHNLDAAGPVHAAEQRISRQKLDYIDQIFSVLYDWASEYGGNTFWPVAWFLVWAGVSFAVLFVSEGTVLSERPLSGWQHVLNGSTLAASAARAGYLTLNQIFNPLGIFGINPLVIPRTTWIAAASGFVCFLATVSLGLLVLALRRRFRLDGR